MIYIYIRGKLKKKVNSVLRFMWQIEVKEKCTRSYKHFIWTSRNSTLFCFKSSSLLFFFFLGLFIQNVNEKFNFFFRNKRSVIALWTQFKKTFRKLPVFYLTIFFGRRIFTIFILNLSEKTVKHAY